MFKKTYVRVSRDVQVRSCQDALVVGVFVIMLARFMPLWDREMDW